YVDDVATAVALAATSPAAAGRVYNVAEPTASTEAEWVAKIGAVVGWNGRGVAVPKGELPGGFNTDQDLVGDSTRIRAELGFKEIVKPDGALRETVRWEQNHLPEETVDYAREDTLMAELGHG